MAKALVLQIVMNARTPIDPSAVFIALAYDDGNLFVFKGPV